MRSHCFAPILLAVLLSMLTQTEAGSVRTSGFVCIDSIPKGDVWKGNDTGATEKSVFLVQIDNQPAVNISTNAAGIFTNLPTSARHLAKIRLNGKPLTSFRFSFAQYETDHLRLWYNTMYGTWNLSAATARHKCEYGVTKSR